MSNTFKLNEKGVRTQILQAGYMQDYIEKVAKSRCGSDEHIKSFIGFDRAKSIIYPNRKGIDE